MITHESQIRATAASAGARSRQGAVAALHPDTPEVRHDWAQYYDNITDHGRDGRPESAGTGGGSRVAEDTIVFLLRRPRRGNAAQQTLALQFRAARATHRLFSGASGSTSRRKDYRPGGASERLVSFVDLAPTLLSITGVQAARLHAGTSLHGDFRTDAAWVSLWFRGRMDERQDLVRTVRDRRYIYLRQYMPHLIYGQHLNYMFLMPTTQVWKESYDQGRLTAPQTFLGNKAGGRNLRSSE